MTEGGRIQLETTGKQLPSYKVEGDGSVLTITTPRCLSSALCQVGHRSVSVPEKCPLAIY